MIYIVEYFARSVQKSSESSDWQMNAFS